MKHDRLVTDYLSKYTIRQLCEEELSESDNEMSHHTHYCRKKQVRKARRNKENQD